MAKLKITKTITSTYGGLNAGQIVDAYINQDTIDSARIGGTGGLTSQTGKQIQPQVYITGGSSLAGSVLAQKGAHKFQVTDGTLTGKCTLVNSPNLNAGQMNILINLSTLTTANVAAANVNTGATSTYMTYTVSTVVGPVSAPRVGDYIIGFTGNAAVAQVTAINATVAGVGNVTIATSGNVASQTGVTATDSTYASRITNKFVYDFNSDSYAIDGEIGTTSSYYTSNYNPVKYRYRLAAPDSIFVQVQSA
jgi:hypothetical protein